MTSTNDRAETHTVENQPKALADYNSFEQDCALKEAIRREGAEWATENLTNFGQLTGSSEMIELGFQANQNKPVLHTHDRFGERVDEVRFHPAYHQLMKRSIEHGLHSSHWSAPKPGAQVARAAGLYLMSQVEAAHICPITMTSAALPALMKQPDVYEQWSDKILAQNYDSRNVPDSQKQGLTIGMAMTEKQGGSDIRTNSTYARPVSHSGPGKEYELIGHKYFVSAPMSDAFLVLAQTDKGLSCFLLPRWRPDGSKNPMQIQQLKNKMGNVANASCETELRGAYAIMIGEEGRGVTTIIEMVNMTRFDCMIGSSSGMRQAVAQVTHHCSNRSAFGKKLVNQPLMKNVLTDLIIEHEAAVAMTFRVARALDNKQQEKSENQFVRIATAVGKYWICKRTPAHAYEAMECIGGSGVMEDCIMPRLFRESPVNSIWEGSGNVQCLDVLRAIQKSPSSLDSFISEIRSCLGANKQLDRFVDSLCSDFSNLKEIEYRAREITDRMALSLQGSILAQQGNEAVFDAFCASRLSSQSGGLNYGTLPTGIDCDSIIKRATPFN
ncbi:MAG: acyl-CoA dehydrogenase family protein [Kangiellaceae bacterium]|nr:acyl-CoA dehydrogenase family protein [Kangiellaceae bacterium]